jgi:Transposase DDE domain
MSSWTPTTYKTKNWSNYNQALKRRGSLSIWFDVGMAWEAKPSGKRGRQQAYSDAAIQACLTFKVLFGLPLRQTTGFVESLLELVGLDWAVPNFSTLCRRQRTLSVAVPYRGSPGPLHLLIDSTGIKAEGESALSAACCACACRVINGTRASMAGQNATSGVRSTSGSMNKHWR